MTTTEAINSYATLNIEYELPFYLRSTGSYKGDLSVNYPEGYLRHYICIILEGKCLLNVDTFSYHLKNGDGFFVRAHCPFEYHNLTGNAEFNGLLLTAMQLYRYFQGWGLRIL